MTLCLVLVLAHGVWERASGPDDREAVVLFNLTTSATLGLAVHRLDRATPSSRRACSNDRSACSHRAPPGSCREALVAAADAERRRLRGRDPHGRNRQAAASPADRKLLAAMPNPRSELKPSDDARDGSSSTDGPRDSMALTVLGHDHAEESPDRARSLRTGCWFVIPWRLSLRVAELTFRLPWRPM